MALAEEDNLLTAADFKMKRYAARTHRVMGGFIITMQRRLGKKCSTRFGQLAGMCVSGQLATAPYGVDAVRPSEALWNILSPSAFGHHSYDFAFVSRVSRARRSRGRCA
eukprot:9491520-Pyramimonas_sp.AAC.3